MSELGLQHRIPKVENMGSKDRPVACLEVFEGAPLGRRYIYEEKG